MKNKIIIFLIFTTNLIIGQTLNIGEVNAKDYFEEIDFEFIKNKIIVPAKINNKTYKFIIDTGAPNLISNELYELLNPRIIDTITIYDANEKKDYLKIVSVEKMKLGNLEFFNTATLVQNFGSENPLNCFGIDGLIGSNMFRNSIIQFDLESKKFRITDDKNKLDLKKRHSNEIKLTTIQSNPYAIIDLKGKEKGREQVLIDTGLDKLYSLSMKNYKVFSEKNIFRTIGKTKGAEGWSLFGTPELAEQYQLILAELTINNFKFKNVTTITSNDDNSSIGAELLKYGVFTIDYINKRFYFQPEKNGIEIHDKDFGFSSTYENGNLIVGMVWDEKLKNKLSYGDIILEINNQPFNLCELLIEKNYFEDENNLELTIKKSDGQIMIVMVEKRTTANRVDGSAKIN